MWVVENRQKRGKCLGAAAGQGRAVEYPCTPHVKALFPSRVVSCTRWELILENTDSQDYVTDLP